MSESTQDWTHVRRKEMTTASSDMWRLFVQELLRLSYFVGAVERDNVSDKASLAKANISVNDLRCKLLYFLQNKHKIMAANYLIKLCVRTVMIKTK